VPDGAKIDEAIGLGAAADGALPWVCIGSAWASCSICGWIAEYTS
jgi:hypothetical protein